MSSDGVETGSSAANDEANTDAPAADLKARVEVLEEENRRLRDEYARARQSQYRQTALGLVAIGVLSALGGLLFPNARTVLFALGGAGTFLGVLTYYLTPERFLPVAVGESVFDALTTTERDVVAELGLRDERVYVPLSGGEVRLFVPQHVEYEIPDQRSLDSVFVAPDDEAGRGVSFAPTGRKLADEFADVVTGEVADDPATLATQVSDAIVEQFELAQSADADADPGGGRITVAIEDSVYGDVDRFDHPIPSFLGTVTAGTVDVPVTVEVDSVTDGVGDYRVTATWDAANETRGEGDSA